MAVIEAADLVKEFSRPAVLPGRLPRLRGLFSTKRDTTRAVNGVNFEIEPGELVGYLGPNGAGKSTTIKMLTGILTPTSGVCRVAGLEPSRDRARNARNIGVVFGQRTQLWYDLPLRDSFEVLADLYDLDRTTYRKRVGLFTELLDLSEFLDTPVRSLSLGQRMRGDLVAAMLHEPSILFLDEPTVGLDVVAKARLTEFIAETNRTQGTTVVLTTHDMEDVERLCQRIIVIDSGAVLYDGDLSRLKERFMPHRFLVLTLSEPPSADRTSADRTSADRTSADRTSAEPTLVDRDLADRALGDRTSGDRTSAESTLTESTLTESTLTESTLTESTLTESTLTERALAERGIRRGVDIPFATEVEAGAVGAVLPHPERSVVLRFDPREVTTPELVARASQVYQIDELSIVDPRLTDVISQLYDGLLT